MRTSSLIIAASVVATGLTFGSAFSSEAQAGPLVKSTLELANKAAMDNFHTVGKRRGRGGSRSILTSPSRGGGLMNGPGRDYRPGGGISPNGRDWSIGSPSQRNPNGIGGTSSNGRDWSIGSPSHRNPNGPDINGGGGGNGGWTSHKNPNRPDFNASNGKKTGKKAGKKFRFHFRVHSGRRDWCHRHYYKVRGMRFHSRVRCDHRHYRAYRSWDFVY